jgi:hypothetical protein
MTAREASARIVAFRASGRAGSVTIHFAAPGKPGQKSVLCTVEVHERLPIDRGEPDEGILDSVARGA